ncbi:MAG: hypothetical protein ACR2IA_03150 [Pyrinomonadaceae bacterium]|nr:hypothetical protein [Acidobacteriota bacterium]
MITNEKGYRQSLYWLKEFEAILQEEKKEQLPDNPQMYKILSGGTLAQIEELKKEIADYERQFLRKAG